MIHLLTTVRFSEYECDREEDLSGMFIAEEIMSESCGHYGLLPEWSKLGVQRSSADGASDSNCIMMANIKI